MRGATAYLLPYGVVEHGDSFFVGLPESVQSRFDMGDTGPRSDVLADLAQLAADLGPALRPRGDEELLQAIVDTARVVFDAAACSIALLSEREDELVFRVAAGTGADATVGLRIPVDRGIAGWAVMAGQSIAIDDVRQDPRFAADIAEATGYMPNSIMAMPLESERATFGVIEVLDRRRSGAEGVDDMELLARFAHQATLAVETSRIFANLGQALFESAALAAPRQDLGDALALRAASAPKPQAELANLALLFHDLGQLGPEERLAAARIAGNFLAYARKQRR
jgi:GAF domain-containing protein